MLEARGIEDFLTEVRATLLAGKYRPSAVRRQYIPKADGKKRPLGIPTIRDRVVQMAAKLVLEPIFEADFREATVVTLYLLPDLNLKLQPRLVAELKPGTRIVSHQFDMGDWKPAKKLEADGRTVYFWVVPERRKAQP